MLTSRAFCLREASHIAEQAVTEYIGASTSHDPSDTKGIENVLLLLVREVVISIEQGDSPTNDAGLNAALRVKSRLRALTRSRGIRRWLRNMEHALIDMAESMAYRVSGRTQGNAILHPPPFGFPTYRKVCEGGRWPGDIGDWAVGFISEPPPKWYVGLLLRPPTQLALRVDELAHRLLMPRAN